LLKIGHVEVSTITYERVVEIIKVCHGLLVLSPQRSTSGSLDLEVNTNGLLYVQREKEFLKVRGKFYTRKFSFSADLSRIRWHSRFRKQTDSVIRLGDVMGIKYPAPLCVAYLARQQHDAVSFKRFFDSATQREKDMMPVERCFTIVHGMVRAQSMPLTAPQEYEEMNLVAPDITTAMCWIRVLEVFCDGVWICNSVSRF
jgi:hypothetical protein